MSEEEVFDHVHTRGARCTAPGAVAFVDPQPKTSTGEVQRFEL